MARFNRRFEVKREMSDGGTIRPDDNSQQHEGKYQLEPDDDAFNVGFDDWDEIDWGDEEKNKVTMKV